MGVKGTQIPQISQIKCSRVATLKIIEKSVKETEERKVENSKRAHRSRRSHRFTDRGKKEERRRWNMIEEVFIELLQVAVGMRACLSRTPSDEEWEKVYEMAVKHAMLGVCFYAIQRLNVQEQVPSHQLLFEWYHVAEAVKHTNEVLNKRCRKLQKKLSEAGIRSSILKGQGIAMYYGNELSQYRQSGDIDVFVDCVLEGALKFAHDIGKETSNWGYKHMHLDIFNDTEVEIHYHVEVLLNLFKNRKLQRWFEAHKEDALGHIDGVDLSEKKELATPLN